MPQPESSETDAETEAHECVPDPAPQEVAQVQAAIANWVLLWSRWRRTWTAVAAFGPAPMIVDDPDRERLLRRCRAAELAAMSGRPAHLPNGTT